MFNSLLLWFTHYPMLALVGSVLCMVMGLLGAVSPARVARLVSIRPVGGLGISEIRATYGGLFLAMGLACLILQSNHAFLVAGASWLGASLLRFPALFLDKGSFPKGLAGALLELTIGLLLLSGAV